MPITQLNDSLKAIHQVEARTIGAPGRKGRAGGEKWMLHMKPQLMATLTPLLVLSTVLTGGKLRAR